MVTRMVSFSLFLGLSSLVYLGLSVSSVTHAAHAVWSAYANQVKRPQFRPWSRAPRRSISSRWRPQPEKPSVSRTPAVAWGARLAGRSMPPGAGEGLGSRQAITRGPVGGLGLRFRPKPRRMTYGSPDVIGDTPAARAYQTRLHAQFRPAQKKRRQTYEQLQSDTSSVGYMTRPAAMVYPVVAASSMRAYGHWPGW